MSAKLSLWIMLCMMINVARAQNDGTYDFKPVQELRRHAGLQDPFLKPDGTRVGTKAEWAVQRQYIKAMLEHYQYGKMPPAPPGWMHTNGPP